MTSNQITQLRQLLKGIVKYYRKADGNSNAPFSVGQRLREALALLPCPTCNGTKRKIMFQPGQREFGGDASTSYEIPCPDCK